MQKDLCDAAVRVELGISRRTAAKLAGVGRNTLTLYEAAPNALGEEKRAACATVYRLMRRLLADAPGKNGG